MLHRAISRHLGHSAWGQRAARAVGVWWSHIFMLGPALAQDKSGV
jgi:hypothetical protein